MFKDKKISFIGSGAMAEAMIRGLLDQKVVEAKQIIAADPWQARLKYLNERYGVAITVDNGKAAEDGQIVVFSFKPQNLERVTPSVRGHLRRQDLLISIVAGVPIEKLANSVAHASVVRAMPNTPAQIGQGITVWTGTLDISELHKGQAQAVLGSLGEEIFMNEERYLDMATALSGSGPGYVFMLMEAMIDAGVHMGFSRHVSQKLVEQTMLGSVEYAKRSNKHVAELRNQVTSPGGTTAEALYHMEKGGLRTVISRGIWAAYQRSIALGRGDQHKPDL
ncbi:MAG: pyrroline-5-carboxylate reductase [Chloroflexi bacterium]|nr:MAG: pyrroline-5-carboxylate reductase [Chloroflexota bacterium]